MRIGSLCWDANESSIYICVEQHIKHLSKVDMLANIKGATQNAYSMSSIYDPYQSGFEPHPWNNKKNKITL